MSKILTGTPRRAREAEEVKERLVSAEERRYRRNQKRMQDAKLARAGNYRK